MKRFMACVVATTLLISLSGCCGLLGHGGGGGCGCGYSPFGGGGCPGGACGAGGAGGYPGGGGGYPGAGGGYPTGMYTPPSTVQTGYGQGPVAITPGYQTMAAAPFESLPTY